MDAGTPDEAPVPQLSGAAPVPRIVGWHCDWPARSAFVLDLGPAPA